MSKKRPLWWQSGYVGPAYGTPPSKAAPEQIRQRTERRRYTKALNEDSGRADAALRKFSWEEE